MCVEYMNKKASLRAGILCLCAHILISNFWNATKKKPFYVPNFETYEGFFHGLSVAVFSNILLFSFSFFKLWKIESWA